MRLWETFPGQPRDILNGSSQLFLCFSPPRAARRGRYPGAVRLTVFWERMRAQFGDSYAESVAKDFVLAGLGGRTVDQALADGVDAKTVWRAVCEAFDVPERLR
jgi:Protein of unknown function (DUF3046)